jgi:hypothetical protein
MPYFIKNINHGYQVCSKKDRKEDKCYSKGPMVLSKALTQFRILTNAYLEELIKEKATHFINILVNKFDIHPMTYFKMVRKQARKNGYDTRRLFFSDELKHKLMYLNPETNKKTYFGLNRYGDYFIYKILESRGQVPPGYADKKRNVFQKSHGKLSELKELDKYTPNELALNINW